MGRNLLRTTASHAVAESHASQHEDSTGCLEDRHTLREEQRSERDCQDGAQVAIDHRIAGAKRMEGPRPEGLGDNGTEDDGVGYTEPGYRTRVGYAPIL